MKITEFIGRHLDFSLTGRAVIPGNHVCKLCGDKTDSGVSGMIGDTFTDYAYLQFPTSEFLCVNCASVMGKSVANPKNGKVTFFRNFSFICTHDKLTLLARENISRVLENMPEPPFAMCVTYNNKKHMAFKACIQGDKDMFAVTTDLGNVIYDRAKADIINAIIRKWYSVIPEKADTKAQPTWFTKDDMLIGCSNYKKIEQYGVEKYFNENGVLDRYRGTGLLKLLVFCLNKRM